MKVHGARQTSIPLQPPLSNKHIYYSGWARLEVSPHTHLQRAAIQGNEIQDALRWEFQTRMSEKKKKKKKKGKQMALPHASPRRGIEGHSQCLHTWRKSLFIRWCFMIFFFFFFRSPAETWSSPLFPPSFFTTDISMTSLPQRRSARVIRSTVSQWLMEILIHWPDTARLLLFSLCAPGDIFYLLVSTHRFIPRAAPHTLMCVISIHRHTHTHTHTHTHRRKTLCIIPSFFF